MATPEFTTIGYSDGYAGQARYWRPRGTPRGAVLYLHGIQSHGGWFEGSACYLADQGLHVLLPDRRGSGRNEAERGHARSAGRLLQDVVETMAWLKGRTGMRSVTLVGVSWGGKLALGAALRQAEDVDRVALVAPGLFPLVDLPATRKAAVAAAALFAPRRRFTIPLNEPEMFTDNPLRQAYIRDDPLRLREATARFLFASRMLDVQVQREARSQAWPFAVTLLLAGKERIVDNERTRQFARGLRCRQMKIIEHRQATHTLEFEAQPQAYYEDLVTAVTSG
jgi:alpha-beta hydrolase superfamily lysophospholipase